MYYLFTFRTRTNAIKFAENVKKEGASAYVVSTPQAIENGCGLSVKVFDASVGKQVLSYGKYASFTGMYTVNEYNGKVNIIKK